MSTFLHGGSGDEHIVLFSCKKKPNKKILFKGIAEENAILYRLLEHWNTKAPVKPIKLSPLR